MIKNTGKGERTGRLSFFQDSYDSCRGAFLGRVEELSRKREGVLFSSIEISSGSEKGLFMDWCLVPPSGRKKNLVVLTSGIHGVEGHAGSAIQQFILSELIEKMDATETGYLLIHSINPHGFRTGRRVTANNVDLNRNFDVSGEIFGPENRNEGYACLHDYLAPPSPVKTGMIESFRFFLGFFLRERRMGLKAFRESVSSGQYEFDRGIYFGGYGPEPHRGIIETLLSPICVQYDRIFAIDLHTGYGRRGTLHFFPDVITDERTLRALGEVFRGFPIDSGDRDSFYRITGEFVSHIGKLVPADRLFLPMTFEFGTVNNHKRAGSIFSLHRIVLENRLAHYGAVDEKTAESIRKRFLREFFPPSSKWRAGVLDTVEQVLPVLVRRFSGLPSDPGQAGYLTVSRNSS